MRQQAATGGHDVEDAMTDPVQSATEDLAYLRAIVDGGGVQKSGGALFIAAGVIYGLQVLGHWAQGSGLLNLGPLGGLALLVGPTVVFLVVMSWILARNRGKTAGSTAKAFNAAFSAIGLTNLVLVMIFGPAAYAQHDWKVWMFYGAVAYALQGTGWLIAFNLRREAWMGLTALGWFAAAVAMGLFIGTATYALIAALALLVLMVGPGLIMMRKAG